MPSRLVTFLALLVSSSAVAYLARADEDAATLEQGSTNRACTVLPEVLARWRSVDPAYRSLVREVENAVAERDES